LSLSYSAKHREIDHELAHVGRLHFSSEQLEDSYTSQFVDSNRKRHRVSCLVGIISILILLILDLATFPEETVGFYLVVRVGICAPFFCLGLFVSEMPSMRKQLPYWVVTAILLMGIGSVLIIGFNYINDHISPYEGMLVIIIATYFLVGLDFKLATMTSILIVSCYVYMVVFLYEDLESMYYNLFFVGVNLVICAVGGFSIEKQLRINFLKNETLTILSQRDGLTGIYNRATLEYKLKMTIMSSLRDSQGIAFALLDLDFFKSYNDHYGHIQGDKCLKAVARALQNCCKRPTDFCARFGGEEFVVVWFPTKPSSTNVMAKTIQHELSILELKHCESSVSDFVTTSGGIVYMELKNMITNDDLFHIADKALYEAKDAGRNQFKIIDQTA
jgi:diguanylate cyclase (GGDEF)-like protein